MANVKIVEVGPRDGLQNIQQFVPSETKIELVRRLAGTGLSVVEATSFVSPKWIPQLADGARVLRGIRDVAEVSNVQFPVLVPNKSGLRRAIENGAKEVAVFVSASEGFSWKNINCSIAESLDRVRAVLQEAKRARIAVRGYVSCIFVCPYDGPIAPAQVISVVRALVDAGCYEVSLGDTIGVGTPADVERLLRPLLQVVPACKLSGHFHDTYGQAVANVVKSYEMGLRTFDSSVAGLGGCPFAKGARGNLATEDILYTFAGMGISTGVDLENIVTIGSWICSALGIPNGSRAGTALAAKKEPTSLSLGSWKATATTKEYTELRRGPDVKIELTRPENGNALTLAMLRSLTERVLAISRDSSIFRLIFTSQGKYFCTGMDLKNDAGTPNEQFDALSAFYDAVDRCPQTTIAAINGPCFGGGIGLAFACDIRLATEGTRFTLSETKLGLSPATISKIVVREWGPSLSRAAMLTARAVTARELLVSGAVQSVCADTVELEKSLESLLETMRAVAPEASSLSKELVRQAWKDPGGKEQELNIKSTFSQMMAQGSESVEGRKHFQDGRGVKDWWLLKQGHLQSKL